MAITIAFQAVDTGSIPVTRSKLFNESSFERLKRIDHVGLDKVGLELSNPY